jgi:hypothetical protein
VHDGCRSTAPSEPMWRIGLGPGRWSPPRRQGPSVLSRPIPGKTPWVGQGGVVRGDMVAFGRAQSEPFGASSKSAMVLPRGSSPGLVARPRGRSNGIHMLCIIVDNKQQRPPGAHVNVQIVVATQRAHAIQISTNPRTRRRSPSGSSPASGVWIRVGLGTLAKQAVPL